VTVCDLNFGFKKGISCVVLLVVVGQPLVNVFKSKFKMMSVNVFGDLNGSGWLLGGNGGGLREQ
jgi:hypothetical protein